MANPSAAVPVTTTPFADDKTKRPLAATAQTYYPGEMIGLDSSGNATKCDDTASLKFDGVQADEFRITVDSGDSAGDKNVTTERPRYMRMYIASATAGDEGRPVFAAYSGTLTYDAGTYKNFVGWVHAVVSSTEIEVELAGRGGPPLVKVNLPYSSPADNYLFVADRAYRVIDARGRVATAAAFTASIKKVANNTTIANGVAIHSSTYDFNGTADNQQVLTLLTNTYVDLAAGDALALDCNATATNAVGVLSITLVPVGK